MNVLIYTTMFDTRQIVVDDVHNVANVQTTSRDCSGNENGALSGSERSPQVGQVCCNEC